MAPPSIPESYNLVETNIAELKDALDNGKVTSVELVVGYLFRIGQMDIGGPQLNSITNVNPNALLEARESDDYRAAGNSPRALEGIPYTLKDGYKYLGMTVSAGSPAFAGLMPNEDAFVAEKLREAGAVLVGKTNMPPLADGGMARGLYGRAESPYNLEYLTAAFNSGSSNGAATATAASFAAFALGGETVSSGRSPASNNGLVAYTPSRGVISCRGVWPLYGTCDVLVPMTRSIPDLLAILPTLTQTDSKSKGDFWCEQPFFKLEVPNFDWSCITPASLKGKRIAVPKMYIEVKDCKKIGGIWDPVVSEGVKTLWDQAREDLEAMGAEIVITDFPLVTRYEDDSASGEPNNIVGAPKEWNAYERGVLISKIWDKFLKENGVAKGLLEARPSDIFPDPFPGCTAQFVEVKNLIDHVDLVALANEPGSLFDVPGMAEALQALEMQRKRDLEDWMDELKIDLVVFPANGDVGKADLEINVESAEYAMAPGVKYSNGNRAIRHLGVPTVSTTMGSLETGMPVNLTFVGKAYSDDQLISYAYSFEEFRRRRTRPRLTPEIWVNHDLRALRGARMVLNECVDGKVSGVGYPRVFVNGQPVDILQYGNRWSLKERHYPKTSLPQGRLLKQKTIVIVVGRDGDHPEVMKRRTVAELFLL